MLEKIQNSNAAYHWSSYTIIFYIFVLRLKIPYYKNPKSIFCEMLLKFDEMLQDSPISIQPMPKIEGEKFVEVLWFISVKCFVWKLHWYD